MDTWTYFPLCKQVPLTVRRAFGPSNRRIKMIAIWIEKAWQRMKGTGWKTSRWMRILSPRIWIILAVAAFVSGRIIWLRASRPPHLHEITAAFGSIHVLESPAQFSPDLSQFTYVT